MQYRSRVPVPIIYDFQLLDIERKVTHLSYMRYQWPYSCQPIHLENHLMSIRSSYFSTERSYKIISAALIYGIIILDFLINDSKTHARL